MSQEEGQVSKARCLDATNAVDDLASIAISAVARRKGDSAKHSMNSKLAQRLFVAVMGRAKESGRDVAAAMLNAGIPPEALADLYIPEAARLMGREWEEDTADFAQVTVGSARLQSILRDLDQVWDTGHRGIGTDQRPLILILTIPQTQHTLGASVLATQLRRYGCSIQISTGEIDGIADAPFGAVFVSASVADGADRVRTTITELRMHPGFSDIPIILGGSILETLEDAASMTGADLATTDPGKALRYCDLARTRLGGPIEE